MTDAASPTSLSAAPASVPEDPGAFRRRLLDWTLPFLVLGAALYGWQSYVDRNAIPPYVLPSPSLILSTLISDWSTLGPSLLVTLTTTAEALALALIGGVGLAILFAQSRIVETALYPFAVVLQVTPVLAIAPLLLIYMPQPAAVLTAAWLVAFFPILSNTTIGLRSVDHNLLNLFDLYGASPWQKLWHLKLKAALPYFLGGLKIAGGLALIGAVVAEIAAGSSGAGSGLAYRIIESQVRLKIPRLFAALALLSVTGIVIFFTLSAFAHLMLRRWHESALKRET
jgi:NitT/TauT family transport system permease protein